MVGVRGHGASQVSNEPLSQARISMAPTSPMARAVCACTMRPPSKNSSPVWPLALWTRTALRVRARHSICTRSHRLAP
jgi:hypothetical protein